MSPGCRQNLSAPLLPSQPDSIGSRLDVLLEVRRRPAPQSLQATQKPGVNRSIQVNQLHRSITVTCCWLPRSPPVHRSITEARLFEEGIPPAHGRCQTFAHAPAPMFGIARIRMDAVAFTIQGHLQCVGSDPCLASWHRPCVEIRLVPVPPHTRTPVLACPGPALLHLALWCRWPTRTLRRRTPIGRGLVAGCILVLVVGNKSSLTGDLEGGCPPQHESTAAVPSHGRCQALAQARDLQADPSKHQSNH